MQEQAFNEVCVGRDVVASGVEQLLMVAAQACVIAAAAMVGNDKARDVLKRLSELGLGLAIGDFGVPFGHLARLPFDTVVIDGATVQAADDDVGIAVLNSTIALAHQLERIIIAEGLRNDSDARRLKEGGCEFGQGAAYGTPLLGTDVDAYLSSSPR